MIAAKKNHMRAAKRNHMVVTKRNHMVAAKRNHMVVTKSKQMINLSMGGSFIPLMYLVTGCWSTGLLALHDIVKGLEISNKAHTDC